MLLLGIWTPPKNRCPAKALTALLMKLETIYFEEDNVIRRLFLSCEGPTWEGFVPKVLENPSLQNRLTEIVNF